MAKNKMKVQIERKLKRQNSSSVISKNTAASKLKKGKMSKTNVKNQSKQKVDLRSRQYSLGRDSGSNVHYYKFTGKQTKNWKPVGKQLKEYLYHLIDSGVRMVGSKPQFSKNEDVQNLLDELKLQLKSNLHTVRVPNKRHGDYSKIKVKTDELREEFESLTQQQLQLEKAIREEERSIEALEDLQNTSSSVKLILKHTLSERRGDYQLAFIQKLVGDVRDNRALQYEMTRKSKRDIGERVPLPEVKGDVLFGIHPVQAALHAGKRCAYTAFFKAGNNSERLSEIRAQCVKTGVETLEVTAPGLDSLSGNHPHQGVCLDVSKYEPRRVCVETDIVSEKMKNSNGEPQVWVLPYKVKDTMNMGAILRSCFYFGVDKVLIPEHYSSSLNPVVSKSSAGALEVMDIQSFMYESTLTKCLKTWKDEGGTVVGSSSDESHGNSLHLHRFHTDCPTLLIIGSEADGISEKIMKYCDVLLCIPNFQTVNQNKAGFCVDSLNVSVATGVLLHSIMISLGRVR